MVSLRSGARPLILHGLHSFFLDYKLHMLMASAYTNGLLLSLILTQMVLYSVV